MNLERTVIALGFFDGVHRGHGALLQKTVQRAGELGAIPAVFTFDRPPKEVVTGRPMPLINSPEDRADLARRIYGIQQVILAPFDEAMMTMPWQDFITELLVKLCPEQVSKMKQSCDRPLIVEIPDRHGSGRAKDSITRYVREAIGVKI